MNMYMFFQIFSFHITCQSIAHKVIIHESRGGTEMKIWTGFGPVGNVEKNWVDSDELLKVFNSYFHGQKNVVFFSFEYCSFRNKKLHKMKVIKKLVFVS